MAGILPSLDAVVDASDFASLERLFVGLDAIERAPRRAAGRQYAEVGT
jgi:hypothetical protein